MKLEKAVSRPKTGLYLVLFVLGLAIAGVMATSYNIEVVVNNLRDNVRANLSELPWFKMILGSLGFLTIMTALIVFFNRMLREIQLSQFHADFLDRVSHELRTPLSTLTLVSDLLKNPDQSLTPEEKDRLWRSHQQELDRLKRDVESLLQAARLRENKGTARINEQVQFQTLDLVDWIQSKWESFQNLLGPQAQLEWKPSVQQLMVRADPTLLELVIRNLLDNAKKFSEGAPKVQVLLQEKKGKFALTVSDSGRGFEQQAQSQLFKRFSRLSQGPDASPVPGTGLGLFLSASASRAMGLALEGKSPGVGQGAVFTLSGPSVRNR